MLVRTCVRMQLPEGMQLRLQRLNPLTIVPGAACRGSLGTTVSSGEDADTFRTFLLRD